MKPKLERAAFFLTCASAVAVQFSIATFEVLLALAFAALLMCGVPLRMPPIRIPLACYFAGTFLSLAMSPDPLSGTPQIRKLHIFLVLVLVASLFRKASEARWVVLAWGGVEGISALRSLFQFLQKYREASEQHVDFYQYYVGERITGFMSHWMTFGGQEMIVLLLLIAFLLFTPANRWKRPMAICVALVFVSLVLGFTRSIFLFGFPLGLAYLLLRWRPLALLVIPVVALVGVFAVPGMRERVASIVQPHGERDSNEHRAILRRTGLEMIKAHPVFGLGPEQTKIQFEKYVPADVPRPLPEGWYGHLHNIYLQYAAERGIPTMLAMMWLIGKCLWDFLRGVRNRVGDARFLLHGGVAAIFAILAEGFFEYNLGDSEVLVTFLCVVAFGYVALRDEEPGPSAA